MGSAQDLARRNLMALSEEMQRMLHDFLACKESMSVVMQSVWRPATDVFETNTHVVIKMDIAGMSEKDIEVKFSPQSFKLWIVGRRVDAHAGRKVGCNQMEIVYGVFQREINLPRGIAMEGITRSYANGFLEIMIPKASSERTRRIAIRIK